MEKNIFENAYLGKPYKTRDGRKAIFIINMGNYNFPYRLVIDGDDSFSNYNEYGRMYSHELPNDIVSEWQETIELSEEEYKEKLDHIYNSCIYWEAYEDHPELFAKSLKELLNFAPKDEKTIGYCEYLIRSRKTIFKEIDNIMFNFDKKKSKEISEEELNELAETEANNTVGELRYDSTDLPKWYGFKEGFKSCYHKLKYLWRIYLKTLTLVSLIKQVKMILLYILVKILEISNIDFHIL